MRVIVSFVYHDPLKTSRSSYFAREISLCFFCVEFNDAIKEGIGIISPDAGIFFVILFTAYHCKNYANEAISLLAH